MGGRNDIAIYVATNLNPNFCLIFEYESLNQIDGHCMWIEEKSVFTFSSSEGHKCKWEKVFITRKLRKKEIRQRGNKIKYQAKERSKLLVWVECWWWWKIHKMRNKLAVAPFRKRLDWLIALNWFNTQNLFMRFTFAFFVLSYPVFRSFYDRSKKWQDNKRKEKRFDIQRNLYFCSVTCWSKLF